VQAARGEDLDDVRAMLERERYDGTPLDGRTFACPGQDGRCCYNGTFCCGCGCCIYNDCRCCVTG
jgi:hypothetical protein